MLKPSGEAQALHIVPFPGEDKELNKPIYEEQIRNSYFNGIVLGYPARFVESYSRDLIQKDLLPERSIEFNIRRGIRLSLETEFTEAKIGKGATGNDYNDFKTFFESFRTPKLLPKQNTEETPIHDEL